MTACTYFSVSSNKLEGYACEETDSARLLSGTTRKAGCYDVSTCTGYSENPSLTSRKLFPFKTGCTKVYKGPDWTHKYLKKPGMPFNKCKLWNDQIDTSQWKKDAENDEEDLFVFEKNGFPRVLTAAECNMKCLMFGEQCKGFSIERTSGNCLLYKSGCPVTK